MNIKKSLYFRTKSFFQKEEIIELARRNNLDYNQLKDLPLELIETMETVKNYTKETNVLLDIGAHKGLFSATANLFSSFDKTICFEPNTNMNESIKSSNTGINLKIENIALSDKKGKAIFHLHEDSSMNSIVDSDNEVLKSEFPWDNPDLMKETEVPTDTLDNYIEDSILQNNSFFIKIDTQGNELSVLKNSLKTLKRTEVILIEFMFLTPYDTDFSFLDLSNFLNENGFDCKGALTIFKRPSKKVSGVDFLFVKRTNANI
jgi:FkbM family methyltransferase